MILEQERLKHLIRQIHEPSEDWSTQQEAIHTLRQVLLESVEIDWLVEFVENRDEQVPIRVGAVQVLGYHRPWQRLDLLHDDRVQAIPARLGTLVTDPDENLTLREALINAIGWQYLKELGVWETLLLDPDAFLRREALYELLLDTRRESVERIIHHLASESDPSVKSAIAWGLCRQPLFFDVALPLLTRAGGNVYLDTIFQVCETHPLAATRALLGADMKYFDVRETLIQRLFRRLDRDRIADLLDLMYEGRHPFAARVLRDVDGGVVGDVMIQLDQTVQQRQDDDWTEEVAKLSLHYWDRFTHLREKIRDLLDDWRRHCPKVIHLAMGRNIYWRD